MAVASLNPFDLASLDIRTSAAMDAGTVSPQSTLVCTTIVISFRSNLCCVVTITLLACPRTEELPA